MFPADTGERFAQDSQMVPRPIRRRRAYHAGRVTGQAGRVDTGFANGQLAPSAVRAALVFKMPHHVMNRPVPLHDWQGDARVEVAGHYPLDFTPCRRIIVGEPAHHQRVGWGEERTPTSSAFAPIAVGTSLSRPIKRN